MSDQQQPQQPQAAEKTSSQNPYVFDNKNILNHAGHHICSYQFAMSPHCLYCGATMTDEDGAFIVLDNPYLGVLHRRCAPWFSFNGEWPHAFPVAYYFEKGKQYGRFDCK